MGRKGVVLKDLGRFGFRSYRLPLGEPGTYEMGPTGYTLSGGPVTPKERNRPTPQHRPNGRSRRRDTQRPE